MVFGLAKLRPSRMASTPKVTRQSVTLPAATARRHFHSVADKLTTATDDDEVRRLKDELARLTFGE